MSADPVVGSPCGNQPLWSSAAVVVSPYDWRPMLLEALVVCQCIVVCMVEFRFPMISNSIEVEQFHILLNVSMFN